MVDVFQFLLILHVVGGSAGLLSGTIAATVKKGGPLHLWCGKVFSIGMIVASISALILSNMPGHYSLFLFAVGGFSLYMVLTGHRMVFLKRALRQTPQPMGSLDLFITLFGASFAIFLIYQSIGGIRVGNSFSAVPAVFGGICLSFVYADVQLLMGKHTLKQKWMYHHIVRMMGALIASYTAVLVVNVHIKMQWILWLLPTVIGSIFITGFVIKYVVLPKNKKHVRTHSR